MLFPILIFFVCVYWCTWLGSLRSAAFRSFGYETGGLMRALRKLKKLEHFGGTKLSGKGKAIGQQLSEPNENSVGSSVSY